VQSYQPCPIKMLTVTETGSAYNNTRGVAAGAVMTLLGQSKDFSSHAHKKTSLAHCAQSLAGQ